MHAVFTVLSCSDVSPCVGLHLRGVGSQLSPSLPLTSTVQPVMDSGLVKAADAVQVRPALSLRTLVFVSGWSYDTGTVRS